MDTVWLAPYMGLLLFAFTMAVTPGPNNVLLMASGVNVGIKRSLPMFAGIVLGFPAMVLLLGLGFTAIFHQYPWLHSVIRWLGLAYLLYLAWLIATAPVKEIEAKDKPRIGFRKAALFQWVNGKAWIMATGAIATYSQPQLSVTQQAGVFALIFFITAIPSALIWLIFGSGLRHLLKHPKHHFYFNQAMALLLILSLAPIILDAVKSLS